MKLSEIFAQLTYGELKQLNLGDPATGTVPDSKRRELVTHINLGLLDLHKRFSLKERHTTLALQPGVVSYTVAQDDLLKIERVLTPEGVEIELNAAAYPYTILTPSYNQLRLPRVLVDAAQQGSDFPAELRGLAELDLAYRAAMAPIPLTLDALATPANVEVDLPQTHLWALLLFVASRVHNPQGMVNEMNMGNNYAMKYEAECLLLENRGLQVDQAAQSTRFERNGWC